MNLAGCSSIFYEKIFEISISYADNRTKILKINRALRLFYKELSSSSQRHFSTMIAAISFINDKYNLEENLVSKQISLSRFCKLLSKNKLLSSSTDEYHFALKYSLLIVCKISENPIPDELLEQTSEIPELNISRNTTINKEKADILRAVVSVNPFYKRKIDATYIELTCRNDDFGDFQLKVGFPYLENANMIFPEMCFNALSAEIIRSEPLTFSIHSPGLFVFEPDYLVDATDLSESYGQKDGYKIYFLKRYFHSGVSLPLVMGNLINSIFDEVLLNPQVDYDTAEKNAFKHKPLTLFAIHSLGLIKGNVLKSELEHYYEKIKVVVNSVLLENYENADFSVESSFISPIYGIQGRLDLLAEYSDDPLRKDIVELKSGSSPSTNYSIIIGKTKVPVGVWINHLAQVVAYNLLLDSTFPNRKGNSSILYIKTDDSPLRDVANLPNVAEKMIVHRNNIILLERAIMERSFKIFNIKDNFSQAGLPSYVSEKIDKFFDLFFSLNDYERDYLLEFSSFILRESYAVKTGSSLRNGNNGYSALWNESLEDKLENNNIICNLKLNLLESDIENLHLVFNFVQPDLFTSFRKGDIAVLFSHKDDFQSNSFSNQLIKCTLKSISSDKIIVSLRNKLISKDLFNSDVVWRLEPDSLDTIDKLSYSSIFSFMSSDKHKRDLIFGKSKPIFSNNYIQYFPGLNENQSYIINKSLNCQDYFLIQGPPGTGKTNVILKNIVKEIVTNTSEIILITAYTNRAVDEIASALDTQPETKEFIRIGSKNASDDTERHLPNVIDKYGMNYAYKKIKNTRIVISTVASILTNKEIFDIKKFNTLIVDEASQILESQLIGLIVSCNKFILIGDEKQLPPVVLQANESRKCKSQLLNELGIYDFSESLFERLLKICKHNDWDEGFSSLEYQARMHIDIQDFPGRFFYNSSLKPVFDHQHFPVLLFKSDSKNIIERILSDGRVIFIDCPAGNNKINKIEADIVVAIINMISSKISIDSTTIGVISPFRLQCFEINKRLNDFQKQFISVDTVERFQGSQREYIILSMAAGNLSLLERAVSSDESGNIDRKLNVAITRAKSHFILLGSSEILMKSSHYANLLRFIKDKNSYYNYLELNV